MTDLITRLRTHSHAPGRASECIECMAADEIEDLQRQLGIKDALIAILKKRLPPVPSDLCARTEGG